MSIRPGAVTLIANMTATAASEDRCKIRGGSRPLNETGVRESPSPEVVGSPFDFSDAPNIDRFWNADSQARIAGLSSRAFSMIAGFNVDGTAVALWTIPPRALHSSAGGSAGSRHRWIASV